MTSIIEESKKAKQNGLLGFWRNKKIIYGLVGILIIGGSLYLYLGGDTEEKTAVVQKEWAVKTGNIIVSVESDGKVVAKDGVELSFSVAGDSLEVDEIFVKEGDKIAKGDKIASVKTETLDFSLRTAWSSYQSALADFNETMDGATSEDKSNAEDRVTSAELSLEQANISLENIKQSVEDDIYDAEKKVDDAKEDYDDNSNINDSEDIKDSYEGLVDVIKSTNISLDSILKDSDEILGLDQKSLNDDFEDNLGVKNKSTLSNAEASYKIAKTAIEDLNNLALSINIRSDHRDVDAAADQAEISLQEFEKHLYDMKLMLDASITSVDFSQAELNSFISSISSNRTSVNTKITTLNARVTNLEDVKGNLDDYRTDYDDAMRDLDIVKSDGQRDIENAEASVASREISLDQAKRDLDELLAPLTESELASARSRLTSSSISLERAQFDLDKSILSSPIDGELVQLNYAAGDIIITDGGQDQTVAIIINNDTLFIEVNIEEADISKLAVGQKAYASFDSLDELRLEGEISFISLTSKTSSNGIVTYLVRVIFTKGENPIREGMSSAIEFVTSEAPNVLVAPVSSIRNVAGKPSAQLQNGEWIPVITGFTDGKNVEVISGLSEGDIILY